jgi:hypothetical protein
MFQLVGALTVRPLEVRLKGRGGPGLAALLVGSLNPPGHLHRERLGVDEHEPVAAQVQRANGGIVALRGSGHDAAAARRARRPFTIACEDYRKESEQERKATHTNHRGRIRSYDSACRRSRV